MNGQDVATIVGFIVILSGLATFTFRTKSECANCQTACRREVYDEIKKKADAIEMKDLDKKFDDFKDFQISIIKEISAISTKIDMILKGSIK